MAIVLRDPEPAPGPAGEDWARCWRCGKAVRRAETSCPHCQARRRRRSDAARSPAAGSSPMTRVMAFFGLMLASSLLYGALTAFGLRDEPATPAAAGRQLRVMAGFELLDAALVGAALLVIGRPPRAPRLGAARPAWLWPAAIAGIALTVTVNGAYHRILAAYLGAPPGRDAVVAATGVTPLVLVAYCVQPAVFEELFFRYLALDTLRSVTSVHAAVGISSLMFGLAHIGVPLSIPMLMLVGVPLAYARVAGGGLALPMVLHFLHNWIILVRS